MNKIYSCIIIGAGPTGISLATKFDNKLTHLIIEKGETAETWKNVPNHMTLLSPWWTNVIDFRGLLKNLPWKEAHANEYYYYLKDLARKKKLNISKNHQVFSIQKNEQGTFILKTDKGDFFSKSVVCASGYFSNPVIPEFISDKSIATLHTSKIKNFDKINKLISGKKILIVGKRTSSGQTLLECHKKGYQVGLSIRSKIDFRRSGFYGKMREIIYFLYEPIWVRIKKGMKINSYPLMDGGKTKDLIDNNIVKIHPKIEKIENGIIYFENSTKGNYDLIILATGYKPSLEYIKDLVNIKNTNGLPTVKNFECVDTPGLYLVGFDNIYDFRSRYLRGIRADTRSLAAVLFKKHGHTT